MHCCKRLNRLIFVTVVLILASPMIIFYKNMVEVMISSLIFGILMLISVSDLKDRKIPNLMIFLFAIVSVIELLISKDPVLERIAVFFIFCMILIPLKLAFLSRMMGSGDVKMICVSPLLLGVQAVIAYCVGAMIAGLAAVLLLILNKASRKSRIPEGPFLALGIWYVYLYMRFL